MLSVASHPAQIRENEVESAYLLRNKRLHCRIKMEIGYPSSGETTKEPPIGVAAIDIDASAKPAAFVAEFFPSNLNVYLIAGQIENHGKA